MRVFYADDDAEEREFFSEAIKSIDHSIECVTATDGAAAIKVLEEIETPDFIFLDLHMPKMDGMECLMKIKTNPKLRTVPVIIYSSAVGSKESYNLRERGAFSVISKQANLIQLRFQLHGLLSSFREVSRKRN